MIAFLDPVWLGDVAFAKARSLYERSHVVDEIASAVSRHAMTRLS